MSYYGSEIDMAIWRIVQVWKQRRRDALWHGVCLGFLIGFLMTSLAWWIA